MVSSASTPFRITFTLIAALAIAVLLGWEHTHGGVKSHHFLQRADMPAFSNLWGLLIVPALAWFASVRLTTVGEGEGSFLLAKQTLNTRAVWSLVGSFLFGLGIAVTFTHGVQSVLEYVPVAMLLAVLTLPVFRPHYLLGFVLGMATAIGAVLPFIVGSILALFSAIIYFAVRPLVLRAWSALRKR